VVGTVGRVKEAIDRGYLSLEQVRLLVIDEADKFCRIADPRRKEKQAK